jgi:CheY-like chemotaxis protein
MTTNIGGIRPGEGRGEPSKALRSLRILIAEDDRDTVLTLAMLLGEEGHQVRSVYGGRQALAALGELNPDVVLLDIAIPELSGWEVARHVKERYGLRRRPLIIGMSGEYKMESDKILSEIIGFDHYLLKPYDPQALVALLALRQAQLPD